MCAMCMAECLRGLRVGRRARKLRPRQLSAGQLSSRKLCARQLSAGQLRARQLRHSRKALAWCGRPPKSCHIGVHPAESTQGSVR